MQVGVYVDGFNLYHSIQALDEPKLKWLSLAAVASSFLKPGDALARTCYFTAIQYAFPLKVQRHRRYIDALEATGVEVLQSKFQKTPKICAFRGASCNFHEEKQTDVRISSEILIDAFNNTVEKFILITADSDQVPTLQALKRVRPACHVIVAAPPGRLSVARELCGSADESFEISVGRLRAALLPRNVYDQNNKLVAACPAEYL